MKRETTNARAYYSTVGIVLLPREKIRKTTIELSSFRIFENKLNYY